MCYSELTSVDVRGNPAMCPVAVGAVDVERFIDSQMHTTGGEQGQHALRQGFAQRSPVDGVVANIGRTGVDGHDPLHPLVKLCSLPGGKYPLPVISGHEYNSPAALLTWTAKAASASGRGGRAASPPAY